jgi:hypothetical protein
MESRCLGRCVGAGFLASRSSDSSSGKGWALKIELVPRRSVRGIALNERQTLVLNRLIEGFEGKLTTSKYASALPEEINQ